MKMVHMEAHDGTPKGLKVLTNYPHKSYVKQGNCIKSDGITYVGILMAKSASLFHRSFSESMQGEHRVVSVDVATHRDGGRWGLLV